MLTPLLTGLRGREKEGGLTLSRHSFYAYSDIVVSFSLLSPLLLLPTTHLRWQGPADISNGQKKNILIHKTTVIALQSPNNPFFHDYPG